MMTTMMRMGLNNDDDDDGGNDVGGSDDDDDDGVELKGVHSMTNNVLACRNPSRSLCIATLSHSNPFAW